MNVQEWLGTRTPRPPIALVERLNALLAEFGLLAAPATPASLQQASDRLLSELLQRGDSARESALDLLAADALMTYMMESAAEDIGTLGVQAERAMTHISTILGDAPAAA